MAREEKMINEFQVSNIEYISLLLKSLHQTAKTSALQSKNDLFILRDLKSNVSIQTSSSVKQQ